LWAASSQVHAAHGALAQPPEGLFATERSKHGGVRCGAAAPGEGVGVEHVGARGGGDAHDDLGRGPHEQLDAGEGGVARVGAHARQAVVLVLEVRVGVPEPLVHPLRRRDAAQQQHVDARAPRAGVAGCEGEAARRGPRALGDGGDGGLGEDGVREALLEEVEQLRHVPLEALVRVTVEAQHVVRVGRRVARDAREDAVDEVADNRRHRRVLLVGDGVAHGAEETHALALEVEGARE
jgi:hypothetical protein